MRNACFVPLPFTPTDRNATVGGDRTILVTTELKARSAVMSASLHVHSVRGPLDGELRGAMRMANVSEAHLHLIEGVCLCVAPRMMEHNFRQIPRNVYEGRLSLFLLHVRP